MSAIYINEETAASLINIDDALKLVEESFSSYSEGKAFNMTRQRMRIRKGALHMLPGAVPYKGVIGFKAYTSFRAGLIFKVHLYDAETGSPLAIIDANEIGRLRTGAASGIASKYMSKKETNTAFIFGGGFQAEAQLEAVHKTTPLKTVYAATRKIENAEAFAEKMSKALNIEVIPTLDIETNLPKADTIITITTSVKPLFEHAMLNPNGVHINAAGSNALIRAEVPEKTIEAAEVLSVDNKDVAAIECGDILPSLEKGRIHWNSIVELGEITCGYRKGRISENGITIFQSQGIGLQDIMCAEFIYRKAVAENLGTPLPF